MFSVMKGMVVKSMKTFGVCSLVYRVWDDINNNIRVSKLAFIVNIAAKLTDVSDRIDGCLYKDPKHKQMSTNE